MDLAIQALSWLVLALITTVMFIAMLAWNISKLCYSSSLAAADRFFSACARLEALVMWLATELRPIAIWIGAPLLLWYLAWWLLSLLAVFFGWLSQAYPVAAMVVGMGAFCAVLVVLPQLLPPTGHSSPADY